MSKNHFYVVRLNLCITPSPASPSVCTPPPHPEQITAYGLVHQPRVLGITSSITPPIWLKAATVSPSPALCSKHPSANASTTPAVHGGMTKWSSLVKVIPTMPTSQTRFLDCSNRLMAALGQSSPPSSSSSSPCAWQSCGDSTSPKINRLSPPTLFSLAKSTRHISPRACYNKNLPLHRSHQAESIPPHTPLLIPRLMPQNPRLHLHANNNPPTRSPNQTLLTFNPMS